MTGASIQNEYTYASDADRNRVLIVDDDEQVLKVFGDIISGHGYLTNTAVTGREALEKARTFKPDIILLDVFMPEIDGVEICRRLRQHADSAAIPVIAVTGYGDEEIKMRCLEAGADDFLTKPVDLAELMVRIRNLLIVKKFGHISLKNTILMETIEAVEAAKKEWETALDCINDIVILIDDKDDILRCNRMLTTLSGKTYPEIINSKWQDVLREAGFTHKTRGSGEVEYVYPGGKCFLFDLYHIRRLKSGPSGYSVITLKDVSELRAVQSQILQQDKMASIGQLAAGVAHEINNPMGFIMSNLQSLSKYIERLEEFIQAQSGAIASLAPGCRCPELEEKRARLRLDYIIGDAGQLLRESLEGAERVKKIVQDLKSFSRVAEKENVAADINAGLESAINMVRHELKYKAELTMEFGDLPLTRCNLGQLNQVFMNMLINAAHAIEKRGVITVRTWREGGLIFISIADTGAGIPAENLCRIFEPFFTTRDVGKGTGLGLSIAYDIVRKHGGDITAESTAGKGTTFTIKIPIVEDLPG